MLVAKLDENSRPTLTALSSSGSGDIVTLYADPTTHRLLCDVPAGSGTVTSVSVVTANGISGTVATATTTPAITLTLGDITPTTVNGLTLASQAIGFTISGGTTSKTLTVPLDASVSGTNTGDQNLSGYELLSNKATDFTTINNTLYPTVQAVNNAITTAVTGLLDYRGSYDASTNLYPATGGSGLAGAILKGDFWICSVAGTLGGTAVTPGDLIIALIDTPAQIVANWDLVQHDINGAYVTTDQTVGQTIGVTGSRLTKLWATDITVTNAITGSVTGNAGTITLANDVTSATDYLVFANTATGANALKTATAISVNPSTAAITATTFVGALTGTASGNLVSGGALGTPSSGTLTNCTGLPAAGVVNTAVTLSDTQTITGVKSCNQIIDVQNNITASGNAATVPITYRLNEVTNNSAATLTITMTTTSAVDGQLSMVKVLPSSAVAQTITWVNTENSTVTAPILTSADTTLPVTVGFQFNSATTKWRCIATA